MAGLPIVRLVPGRDKKIRARYPWVQREEVAHAPNIPSGTLVHLHSSSDEFLGVGSYNALSRFPVRVLTRQDEPIDVDFFRRRIREALARRTKLEDTDSMRVLFSEVDNVPGLILDRFGDTCVVQVRTAGMELLRPVWGEAVEMELEPACLYDKSDMEGRKEEGLDLRAGILTGRLPKPVLVRESGLEFESLVEKGLKTGFYLDQRETRRRLADRVQPGELVLDAFSYVGAFGIYAARAGAEVMGVDIHEPSVAAAKRNAKRNDVECDFQIANVFEWLQSGGDGRKFDWMILDPPAIAKSKDKRDSLKWGIWKLVYHGIDSLAIGGRMVVCSCSYQLGLNELIDTVRLAAADRSRIAYLEEVTVQGVDHPISAHFPESWYLKCAWFRFEA
jgi:23S rRNA (cytosine1962-C5)-methyltransferase